MHNSCVVLLAIFAGIGLFGGVSIAQTTTTTSPQLDRSPIPLQRGQKCPIKSCGRNELLRTCSNMCYHNSCNNSLQVQICQKVCHCGCYCRTGYVRVSSNGPCILPKQCPQLELINS